MTDTPTRTLVGPTRPSALYRLIETKLGASLAERMLQIRPLTGEETASGHRRDPDQTWTAMSRKLEDETGVPVTNESVRRWYEEVLEANPALGTTQEPG